MDKVSSFLKHNQVQSDELGRAIIQDIHVLEKINGAIADSPEFMIPDVACGNGNCAC